MYVHFFKRFIDLIVALCAFPFFCVIYIILAPFYFFMDRGPMFYSGKRLGQYGKPFPMHKFRSMKVNAPDIRLKDGSTYNGDDDPRVTKLGKFLRKTSLDEIPQILNVLKGDMSLIGPRPDPLDWLDKYKEEEKVFLDVKPGITGYNQAYFRNSADAQEKINNDVYYAKNISFWLDVKIILMALSESVASRLRENGFQCKVVEISIRDNELYHFSRQCKLKRPTNITDEIVQAAYRLFKDNYRWEHPIRSLGVRGCDLVSDDMPYQLDLFISEQKREKLEKMDQVVDEIRARFGYQSIQRAFVYQDKILAQLNAREHTVHPQGYFHG